MIIRKPFYFMRHGLTDWNFEGLCQGQVDVPLNDTGVRQAYENIVQQHEITHVFYSPLKRASQTAEIVSKFISATKIEMIEIQECNFGNRQGKPWKLNSWADLKTLDYPMDYAIKKCQTTFRYTDEEMEILSKELRRYFILGNKCKGLGMYSTDVDNLWHMFILFTKEYAKFGNDVFGHFFHHAPEDNSNLSDDEKRQAHKKFVDFITVYEETFQEPIHSIWLLNSYQKFTDSTKLKV